MASKKLPQRSGRPQKDNKIDKRCAFIIDERGPHDEVGEGDWCFGCHFYVCESCSHNMSVWGGHDVAAHLDYDDEE